MPVTPGYNLHLQWPSGPSANLGPLPWEVAPLKVAGEQGSRSLGCTAEGQQDSCPFFFLPLLLPCHEVSGFTLPVLSHAVPPHQEPQSHEGD